MYTRVNHNIDIAFLFFFPRFISRIQNEERKRFESSFSSSSSKRFSQSIFRYPRFEHSPPPLSLSLSPCPASPRCDSRPPRDLFNPFNQRKKRLVTGWSQDRTRNTPSFTSQILLSPYLYVVYKMPRAFFLLLRLENRWPEKRRRKDVARTSLQMLQHFSYERGATSWRNVTLKGSLLGISEKIGVLFEKNRCQNIDGNKRKKRISLGIFHFFTKIIRCAVSCNSYYQNFLFICSLLIFHYTFQVKYFLKYYFLIEIINLQSKRLLLHELFKYLLNILQVC